MKWLLSLILIALPWPAAATLGGATWLEPLGVEATDARLYLLEHDESEAGALPQLWYFDLDGEQAAGPVRVRSWYTGEASQVEADFEGRLQDLRHRTLALERAPLDGLSMTVKYLGLSVCPGQQGQPSSEQLSGALAQASLEERAGSYYREASDDGQGDAWVSICRQEEVLVNWDELSGTIRLETWGAVELATAWSIPNSDKRLVLLRHQGITHESGYAAEVALLLAPHEDLEHQPEETAQALTSAQRCRQQAGAWLGSPQTEIAAGDWLATIEPRQLTTIEGELRVGREVVDAALPYELWTVAGYDCPTVAALRPMDGGYCVLGGWGDCFGGLGLELNELRSQRLDSGGSLVFLRVTGTFRGWTEDDVTHEVSDESYWIVFGVELPGYPGVRSLVSAQGSSDGFHQLEALRFDSIDAQGRIVLLGERQGELRFVVDPAAEAHGPER